MNISIVKVLLVYLISLFALYVMSPVHLQFMIYRIFGNYNFTYRQWTLPVIYKNNESRAEITIFKLGYFECLVEKYFRRI